MFLNHFDMIILKINKILFNTFLKKKILLKKPKTEYQRQSQIQLPKGAKIEKERIVSNNIVLTKLSHVKNNCV
jgi:hypothetical protein